MASILDQTLFGSMRDIPLPTLKGSSPKRVTPIDHGFGRDNWVRNHNIWQNTPRMFDYISRDERQQDFPKRNHKVAMTDIMEQPHNLARASTNDNHNKTSMTANEFYPAPTATVLPGRQTGPLVSPPRPRNNGILGSDTGSSRTNLGGSSLLTGSSPDIEPPRSLNPSLAYPNTSKPMVNRSLRYFNVRDAEEFVPSHLRHPESQSAIETKSQPFRLNTMAFDELSNGYDTFSGPDVDRSSNTHGALTMRQQDRPGLDYPLPGKSVPTANNVPSTNEAASYQSHRSASHLERNTMGSYGSTISQNTWTTQHNASGFNHTANVSEDRKHSSLRPDVASYNPSRSRIDLESYLTPQSNNMPRYDSRGYCTSTATVHSYARNQHTVASNVNAFNVNSAIEQPLLNDHQGSNRLERTSPSNAKSLGSVSRGLPDADRTTKNHRHDHITTSHPKVKISNEEVQLRYLPVPEHVSYTNDPHYQYSTSTPSTPQYPQYLGATPSNGNQFQSSVHAQEPDSTDVARSELLEEFRAYHKSRKYDLKDIYGHVVEFSGDQTGSRFIQTKLEQANSDEKDQIFSELQTNARQLMSDVFGNYVIQKMFEYGNQSQKKILASHMQGYVLKLSLQPYGCRCVQKALEHILTDQQAVLIRELDGHVISVVESQHGNHVIQKAIECIPGEHIQFIVDAHRNQVVRMAKHPYGCRIVQRMIEYCLPHARRAVLDELHSAIPLLIDDQFGNYVIQCMILRCGPDDQYRVIEIVQRELLYYSMHKFASNVVEKAIQKAEDSSQRAGLIRHLTYCEPSTGVLSPILTLLKDQYGNYVLQTVLKVIEGPAKYALAIELRHHLDSIKHVNRGRQVAAMAEIVNNIIAEYSPSSISTGLQTPRTPTSLHHGGDTDTTLTKAVEMIPAGFIARESQNKYDYV